MNEFDQTLVNANTVDAETGELKPAQWFYELRYSSFLERSGKHESTWLKVVPQGFYQNNTVH